MAESTYRIDGSRIASRRIGDESVVLDLSRSLYFGLNGAAGVMWQLLLAGASRPELVEELRSATAADVVTSERIEADVDDFLAALQREGLVDERRTPPR